MRDLKRGEIKQILIDQARESIPEFTFLVYKNNCYTFQRVRAIGEINVYEFFHIIFSLKDGYFSCSVASRLNKTLLNDKSYNTGMINPHKDLIVLKKGTGVINLSEAYYYSDGKFETTIIVVKEIFEDFKKYGLDFFHKQIDRLSHNEIIKAGLSYLKFLAKLQTKLTDRGIHEKIQLELKEQLFAIEGQTRDDRKEIVRAARELINLYLDNPQTNNIV